MTYKQEFDLPEGVVRVDEYTFHVDTYDQGLAALRALPDKHDDGSELIIEQAMTIVPQTQGTLIQNVERAMKEKK